MAEELVVDAVNVVHTMRYKVLNYHVKLAVVSEHIAGTGQKRLRLVQVELQRHGER